MYTLMKNKLKINVFTGQINTSPIYVEMIRSKEFMK
jgi:hypothetical protein